MKTIRVVRLVTYEGDAEAVKKQMENSLPVGPIGHQYGRVEITVAHEHGPQWPTDGKRLLDLMKETAEEEKENREFETQLKRTEESDTETANESVSASVPEPPPVPAKPHRRSKK